MKKILLILFLLLLPTSVQATDYYLDGTLVSDCAGGAGTSYSIASRDCSASDGKIAWNDLATANSTLDAGDTLYMRGGVADYEVYNVTAASGAGEGIQPDNSGTDYANMITYATYNNEKVHLQGNNNSSSTLTRGIQINQKNYIKVTGSATNKLKVSQCNQNIRLEGDDGSNFARYNELAYIWTTDTLLTNEVSGNYAYSSIVMYKNTEYNWIHHCKFQRHGYEQAANVINIGPEPGWGITGLDRYNVFENNEFAHAGHSPVSIQGIYNVFRNNYIHNEPWTSENATYEYGFRGSQVYGEIDNNNGTILYEGNRIGHAGNCFGRDPATYSLTYYNGLGTNGLDLGSPDGIFRYNSFFNNGGKAIDLRAAQYASSYYMRSNNNRIFNNTFYYNGHNYTTNSDGETYADVINFLYSTATDHETSTPMKWQVVQSNVIKNNLFYDNFSNQNNEKVYGHGERLGQTLTNATNCPASDTAGCNIIENNYNDEAGENVDPLFTDETLTSYSSWTLPDLNLQTGSLAIDQGTYLTQASNSGTDSKNLTVDDARYFQDGKFGSASGCDPTKWASGVSVQADYIAIGTVSNTVQISEINYSTNTITLASATTWSDDAYIWLYRKSDGDIVLINDAPDMGAYEFLSGSIALTGTLLSNNSESDLHGTSGLKLRGTITWDSFVSGAGSGEIALAIIAGLDGSDSFDSCVATLDADDLDCTTEYCELDWDACAGYLISENDTVVWTFPASATEGGIAIVATPSVEIIAETDVSPPVSISNLNAGDLTISNIGAGNLTVTVYE